MSSISGILSSFFYSQIEFFDQKKAMKLPEREAVTKANTAAKENLSINGTVVDENSASSSKISKKIVREPTLDDLISVVQEIAYSYLTAEELGKVKEANSQLESPTNISAALKQQKEALLLENPEYRDAVKTWNIPLVDQNT